MIHPCSRMVRPSRPGVVPSWAVAGFLTVFAGATYYKTIRNVSSDDLERELEREIEAEARKQQKLAAAK